jgi:hypothetical protein
MAKVDFRERDGRSEGKSEVVAGGVPFPRHRGPIVALFAWLFVAPGAAHRPPYRSREPRSRRGLCALRGGGPRAGPIVEPIPRDRAAGARAVSHIVESAAPVSRPPTGRARHPSTDPDSGRRPLAWQRFW